MHDSAGAAGLRRVDRRELGRLFSEQARVPYADAMLTRLPTGVDPAAAAAVSDNP